MICIKTATKFILWYRYHWNKKGLDIALDETLKVLSTAYPAVYYSSPDSQLADHTNNTYQLNP
jgi:hypothetical protein